MCFTACESGAESLLADSVIPSSERDDLWGGVCFWPMRACVMLHVNTVYFFYLWELILRSQGSTQLLYFTYCVFHLVIVECFFTHLVAFSGSDLQNKNQQSLINSSVSSCDERFS